MLPISIPEEVSVMSLFSKVTGQSQGPRILREVSINIMCWNMMPCSTFWEIDTSVIDSCSTSIFMAVEVRAPLNINIRLPGHMASTPIRNNLMTFEVLTAGLLKIQVFWDVLLCH
jgi:hypothetical protein